MRQKAIISITLLLLCLFTHQSCSKYEVQYEGPLEQSGETTDPDFDLAIIAGGIAYLLVHDALEFRRAIPSTSTVELIALSNNKKLLAYKERGRDIAIYDIEKSEVTELISGTSQATSLDWHSDNQTIMYGTDRTLHFYGPNAFFQEKDIFNLGTTIALGPPRIVSPLAMTSDNQIVWTYYYNVSFSNDIHRLIVYDPSEDEYQEYDLDNLVVWPAEEIKAGRNSDILWLKYLDRFDSEFLVRVTFDNDGSVRRSSIDDTSFSNATTIVGCPGPGQTSGVIGKDDLLRTGTITIPLELGEIQAVDW